MNYDELAKECGGQPVAEEPVGTASVKSPNSVKIVNDFEIFLPGEPELPTTPVALNHINELINHFSLTGGWWDDLFSGSKVELAASSADRAEHLFRLQKVASASEAEYYLRKHNLWTAQLQAIVQQEAAATQINQHRISPVVSHVCNKYDVYHLLRQMAGVYNVWSLN